MSPKSPADYPSYANGGMEPTQADCGRAEGGTLKAAIHPLRTGEALTTLYRRGLRITVASGGRVMRTDAGRPWLEYASAISPGPLPMLLPA